jgi:hypothetical protein
MDLEREEHRQRYQLCWAAFGIIALALIMAFVDWTLGLALLFHTRVTAELRTMLQSPLWDWLVRAPVTWLCLIGVYLLWGRWTDSGWQRRAGFLVVMNLVDVVLWVLDHGEKLGLPLGNVDQHWWLRHELGAALGWAELALMASLAADVAVHLGREEAAEAGVMARSIITIGAFLFFLAFWAMTDWPRGWPLALRPIRNLNVLLAVLGWHLLFIIALFQVTTLSIAACRLCGQTLAQMDRDEQQTDLLRSRSEEELFVEAQSPALRGRDDDPRL